MFVEEQGVSEQDEWDGLDDSAIHFVVYDKESKGIACARLRSSAQDSATVKIERMAVMKDYRLSGVGHSLLKAILSYAAPLFTSATLSAQAHVVDFYKAAGFVAHGEEFQEAGISHIKMNLAFGASAIFREFITQSVVRFLGSRSVDFYAQLIFEHSRRTVRIQCAELPPVFNSEAFLAIIRACLRKHRGTKIEILVRSEEGIKQRYGNFVTTLNRMSSRISLRKLTIDAEQNTQFFIVGDRSHLLFLNDSDSASGFLRLSAGAEANHFDELFARNWQSQSNVIEDLRQLYL